MKKESKNLKSITERNSNDKSQRCKHYEITIKYNQYKNKPDFYKKLLKMMNKMKIPALIIGPIEKT